MKTFRRTILLLCAALVLTAPLRASDDDKRGRPPERPTQGSNPAVVIVSSAAKGAWVVTKFTAKNVGKPVAKTIFLKAAPSATKFLLKAGAKHALPLVVKLSVL